MTHRQGRLTIGIDLGTYNSAASFLLGDGSVMLRPAEGETDQGMCFPSVVEFDEEGEVVQVGEYARRMMPMYPERVVSGVKRLIGKAYREAKAAGDVDRFDYQVFKSPQGGCRIRVGRREYTPTEITTLILKKIKQDAEAAFNPIGREVREAVITVPAYFDTQQKVETEAAARAAGFENVRLIPEPTAAACGYRLQVDQENQYIVVIDLGAGTLDVTVALLYLDDDGQLQTEEKGHGGDTALGGLDMDDAILQQTAKRQRLRTLIKDPRGRARLRAELEKAKIELSTAEQVQVGFAFGDSAVKFALTRQDIEAAVHEIVQRCRPPIRAALREADLRPEDLSHVLLVGGPTMMPVIRKMVMEEFHSNSAVVEEIRSIEQSGPPVNPMEAVARGALLGEAGRITPHAYGALLDGGYYELVPRRQRYPCNSSVTFVVDGRRKSLELGVIRKSVDLKTFGEDYTMLGVFQFDYRPEPGRTQMILRWEYTDNGTLDFQVIQASTLVHLPLYEVSRLEGRRIPAPAVPIQVPVAFQESEHGRGAGEGDFAAASFLSPERWSEKELDEAIRLGKELTKVARARIGNAGHLQKAKIEKLITELTDWMQRSWGDLNTRTPQIQNLNRGLLNLLHASQLVAQDEWEHLTRGSL